MMINPPVPTGLNLMEVPAVPHSKSGDVASLRGVHFPSERVFTLNRIERSLSFGLGVHFRRNS